MAEDWKLVNSDDDIYLYVNKNNKKNFYLNGEVYSNNIDFTELFNLDLINMIEFLFKNFHASNESEMKVNYEVTKKLDNDNCHILFKIIKPSMTLGLNNKYFYNEFQLCHKDDSILIKSISLDSNDYEIPKNNKGIAYDKADDHGSFILLENISKNKLKIIYNFNFDFKEQLSNTFLNIFGLGFKKLLVNFKNNVK